MNKKSVQSMHSVKLIYHYVKDVFPLVKQELSVWQNRAEILPDQHLSQQALESIQRKAFHCQGGSIYALYPGANTEEAIRFIVAYQTMSDYLDNLVDNLEVINEQAFSQLHLAMQEALNPDAELSDYYHYYPYADDGGYLEQLVRTCQMSLRCLPSYAMVQQEVIALAQLYSALQTYKHLSIQERERKMLDWIEPHLADYSDLTAWEFAAATGSTLGIFCLYAAAFDPYLTLEQVKQIKKAYFPWLGGLHILLDYFIDLKEDQDTQQLNFVAYYDHSDITQQHLLFFLDKALQEVRDLPNPSFHSAVIQGLLAMYLSDEKTRDENIQTITQKLLKEGGMGVNVLYWTCCQLRKRALL